MLSKSIFVLAAFVTVAAAPIAQADVIESRSDLEDLGYVCMNPDSKGVSICIRESAPAYECDSIGVCVLVTPSIRQNPGHNTTATTSTSSAIANVQPTSSPQRIAAVPLKATVK